MARATLKFKRPITQIELDLDENSLEAVGFIRMSKAKTNADHIRSMTDKELAEKIVGAYGIGGACPKNHTHLYCCLYNGCVKCWISWLKSPMDVDE